MVADVTIAFIGSNEFDLMRETIPHNIDVLASRTTIPNDILLFLDNAEEVLPNSEFCSEAFSWGIDEIRFRSRKRNTASGDKSNNSHLHLFSDKTKYLITIECDVALFSKPGNDILSEIVKEMNCRPSLAIATRVDDYQCWVDPLRFLNPRFGKNVASVNRLSSHFLVYNSDVFRQNLNMRIADGTFFDDGITFFNYEDFLSKIYSGPEGPGIGFFENITLQVYHCDTKIYDGSPFYTGDVAHKIKTFRRIKSSVGWARP